MATTPLYHTRRAVFSGPGLPLTIEDHPLRSPPGPGEHLIEIILTTLCGSDLHTVEGRRTEPTPAVLGHEGVGRVIAAGPGGNKLLVGRRVTWPLIDTCGACLPCTRWDLPQKCEHLFKYGHAHRDEGIGLNGCFATHLMARKGTPLIALPDAVTDVMAAPANCALATMVAVTEPHGRGGGLAVIQGGGLLGLLGCALLKAHGWRRVVVVDISRDRLALAEAVGAETALMSALQTVGDSQADLVIEASGSPQVIDEGIRLLRVGGRYELVGMVHPDSQLNLTGERIIRKCLTLRGTHNYGPRHLEAAVAFLAREGRELPWERLVSPSLPLSNINEAIELARTGRWPRVSLCPGGG